MKKLLLSICFGLTAGSAFTATCDDVTSNYDANQDNTLRNIQLLSALMRNPDLSYDDFITTFERVIANAIRLQSMRIAPGHVYDVGYCKAFALPYITQINSLPASKYLLNDVDKRIKYTAVVNQTIYCLMNWHPFVSEQIYKQILKEFQSQLTAFIKEYTNTAIDADYNAQVIIEKLNDLTTDYYQEKLTQDQKDMLLTVEKNEDPSFVEGMSGLLIKCIQDTIDQD